MLKSIGGGHKLNPEAADAWLKLEAEAVALGFVVVVRSSTRDSQLQKELFSAYIKMMARWMRNGSLPEQKPKPVAKPGQSEHEEPRACAVDVDVSEPKFRQWLLRNSTTYGFYFTALGERWHLAHYADGPPTHLRERHLSNLKNFGAAG